MKFVDRVGELKDLHGLEGLAEKKLVVAAIYGLRRIGKTRLLLEFLNSKGLYFFVNKGKTSRDLLNEYAGILKEKGILAGLESLESWDEFLDVLIKRNRLPVVFDEFQNFFFVDPSVFGSFQKAIDLNEQSPSLMVFSGSLTGLMKKLFQSSKEPLYGRIKKGMRLAPLSLNACFEIGRELKLGREEVVKLHCIFGGFPLYYVLIEDFGLAGSTAEDIVEKLLLEKNAPLDGEVNTILAQEFGGRSGRYYSILEAIANGNNTLSAIAGFLNVPITSITRQVNELKEFFELIELEMPFKGKRGIYKLRHALMQFWFSQFYRNYSAYKSRNPGLIKQVKSNLNSYFGKAFEVIAREFLVEKLGLVEASRQWGKIENAVKGENAYEIDLLGKSEKGAYAFEFKWKQLNEKQAVAELEKLRGKTLFLKEKDFNPNLGIVARKIIGKKRLRQKGFLAFDISDF